MRLVLDGCEVDLASGVVHRPPSEEALAPKERDLLAYLAARTGETVSRDELLTCVWGYADTALSRTVDTTVRRLRKKIERDPVNPVHVVTVHGMGYRLERVAASPVRRTNLVPEATSFVGRARELAWCAAGLAEGARLLVLLGPAGAGKTRLSRRLASEAAPEAFPGGTWFADLTEARSRDAVVAAVARVLDVPLANAPDGVTAIGHALAGRGRTLLVLDNAEQVVDDVAVVTRAWLAAADVVLVVTSRERLRLVEEVVLDVEPLHEDDAVRLFVDRASAVRAGFVHREEDEPVVRRIAAALEGLPLAIELAAARAGLLAPDQLLARLEQGVLAAAGTRRDASGRQATLRGALEWSWALLDERERAGLAATAVFRGGFDLLAFEAVSGLGDAAMDVLHDLVDQSLVRTSRAEGGVRFGTYEYVRAFADEKLGGEARRATIERHRGHYLAVGEALAAGAHRRGGIAALERLATEADNLIAVHDRAADEPDARVRSVLALDPVLYVRGPHALHHALLDAAAVVADAVSPRLRALVLRARGDARRQQGRTAEAAVDLDAALAIARETGDGALIAEVLATRGLYHVEGGRSDDAEAELTEARALAAAAGDRGTEGLALSYLGIVHQWRGRLADSERALEEALACLRDVGDRAREGNVLVNVGILALAHGRHADATARFDEALAIAREAGSRRREAIVLVNVASVHFAAGRLQAAEEAYARAHALHLEVGQRRDAAIALGNLGWLLLEQGRAGEARDKLARAVEMHREVGNRRTEGIALGNLGVLFHGEGDAARAREHYERAIGILREFDDRRAWSHFLAWLGALHAEEGRLDEAAAAFEEAERVLGEAADPVARAMVDVNRGWLDRARGDADAARTRLDAVAALAERSAEVRRAARRLSAVLG